MTSWGFSLVGVAILLLSVGMLLAACDDDEDDEADDEGESTGECLEYDDTTCFGFCRCERETCLETAGEDACDAAMCECADLHGCLTENVVADYNCQAVD